MRTRARSPSRATARPLGGEGSKATDRARGLGDSPDVLRAAQGCSHLRGQAGPRAETGCRVLAAAWTLPVRRRPAWPCIALGVWSMLAPPACKTSSRAREPERAEASHVRGGSCPRARPAPRVRVVSVRGHRPLLSTVQTTPCASRGAGARAGRLALSGRRAPRPLSGRARPAPRARGAEPRHASRPAPANDQSNLVIMYLRIKHSITNRTVKP